MEVQHQHRLDLRVVVGVVAREQGDGAAVVGAEARGWVAHALADQAGHEEGEDVDARPPADRRRVPAVVREEARAAHHVHAVVGVHDRQQSADLLRVVLAVAVHLDHVVVAVVERVEEARLHGAADAEVERVAQDARARVLRDALGVVGRAVVDHEHVEGRRVPADGAHDGADGGRLVVGGNDGEM